MLDARAKLGGNGGRVSPPLDFLVKLWRCETEGGEKWNATQAACQCSYVAVAWKVKLLRFSIKVQIRNTPQTIVNHAHQSTYNLLGIISAWGTFLVLVQIVQTHKSTIWAHLVITPERIVRWRSVKSLQSRFCEGIHLTAKTYRSS